MHTLVSLSVGVVLGGVSYILFGDFNGPLIGAIVFMLLDLLTGLIKALTGKSDKSEGGRLSSDAIWMGLLKKVAYFSMIVAGQVGGWVLGCGYIRDAICYAIMASELLSIAENLGQIGVPVPAKVRKLIDLLSSKEDEE